MQALKADLNALKAQFNAEVMFNDLGPNGQHWRQYKKFIIDRIIDGSVIGLMFHITKMSFFI